MGDGRHERWTLASGGGLVESVRWRGSEVWWADWHAGAIRHVDVNGGAVVDEYWVRSFPLCFDIVQSEIIVHDASSKTLLRGVVGEDLRVWADLSEYAVGGGNEVVAAPGGGCFVNFGNFDPARGFPDRPVGRIAHVDESGGARLVADELAFPNGMAVTADGRLLCAQSHAQTVTAFAIHDDGTLGEGREWARTHGVSPDGISLGPDGTLWAADVGSASVVRYAEGGIEVGRIRFDQGAFSCAASPDGWTLAVATADWPGAQRMGDPDWDWNGTITAVRG